MSKDAEVAFEGAIPVVPGPAPEKISVWQRAKSAVSQAARKVAGVFSNLGGKIARGYRRAIAKTKITAYRAYAWARPAVSRISETFGPVWVRVIRPFLLVRVVWLMIVGWAVGLAVAPVITALAMLVVMGTVIAAIYATPYLEESPHAVHRTVLRVVRAVAAGVLVFGYVVATVTTIALCAVSVPVLIASVLELTLRYLGTRGALLIAAALYALLTASWIQFVVLAALAALSWAGRARESEAPSVLPNRRVKLPACEACHEDKPGPRLNYDRHRGLCQDCFNLLAQERAIEAVHKRRKKEVSIEGAPDVSVVQASVPQHRTINKMVWISNKARAKLSQIELSTNDPSKIYWAETAWWFDRKGTRFVRRWDGYVAGCVVAVVNYEHDADSRGFYLGLPLIFNKKMGPYKKLVDAQDMAKAELFNAALTYDRALEEIQEGEPSVDKEDTEAAADIKKSG